MNRSMAQTNRSMAQTRIVRLLTKVLLFEKSNKKVTWLPENRMFCRANTWTLTTISGFTSKNSKFYCFLEGVEGKIGFYSRRKVFKREFYRLGSYLQRYHRLRWFVRHKISRNWTFRSLKKEKLIKYQLKLLFLRHLYLLTTEPVRKMTDFYLFGSYEKNNGTTTFFNYYRLWVFEKIDLMDFLAARKLMGLKQLAKIDFYSF